MPELDKEYWYAQGYQRGIKDAMPVGRWIRKKNGSCFCSNCKTAGSPEWKCCPACTARMDGGRK